MTHFVMTYFVFKFVLHTYIKSVRNNEEQSVNDGGMFGLLLADGLP